MPIFEYTASDRQGALSHGQVEASDKAAASRALTKQGLFVMSIAPAKAAPLREAAAHTEPESPPPEAREEHPLKAKLEATPIEAERTVAVGSVSKLTLPRRSWSRMDRALYLRQLQIMFQAGIPLYRAAGVLAQGKEYNRGVQDKLKEIPTDLERGRMLSKALQRSGLFSHLIVSTVRLGEESGQLDTVLDALSDTEEQAVQLKRALVSRLTYPAVVMLAMSLGLVVLGHVMARVMASMPALQKMSSPVLSTLSGAFQNKAFLPISLILLIAIIAGCRRLWRLHRSRLLIEQVALSAPIVGPLLKRLEANSVTGQLSLLIKSGLAMDRGLGLCAELVRTLSFRRALLLVQQEVREGQELGSSLKDKELFPEDVLALVQAGEIAGSLEDSLDTAARYCSEQVERTLDSALAVLEPLLIGLMGIAIGAVLILTFVPIFSTLKDL